LTNIQNKKVFDVSGNKDFEMQNVHAWKRHGGANQRWRIVYVDRARKEQDKGFQRHYGFHIGRAFYFRSRLPMRRIAEAVSTNIKLRRWNKGRVRQQTFRFDGTTKTIKSQYYKQYSLDITSNGRAANLRLTTTNSRWW
jgi:hypothetical protein